jgi:shikimate kinase
MNYRTKIALTGFMGVGKSSVARHLARLLRTEYLDLDKFIEQQEQRKIAEIINGNGADHYRIIETRNLFRLLQDDHPRILSLGGGAWIAKENRELLKSAGYTSVWLEATFEHCWLNIKFSHKERPLASSKEATRKLFEERQSLYCLADWHFLVRPGDTSFDVAKRIRDEIFG